MIRKPAVAGQFYPDSPDELRKMIDFFMNQIILKGDVPDNIHGLIVPHAGYVYSGKRAAKAYKYILDKDFRNVVVISPSHREFFDFISVYEGDGYETPLGIIERCTDFDDYIHLSDGVFLSKTGHRNEHALEVQLPFLQIVLKAPFRLLPIVLGNQNETNINRLSAFLKKIKSKDPELLIVASSDLSHFHSVDMATRMDGEWIQSMRKYDIKSLKDLFFSETCEACGGGAIIALMESLKNNRNRITVTGYSHSGEINYDNSSVVGYTSAIIWEGEE
mgnify:CR=1 FL=1